MGKFFHWPMVKWIACKFSSMVSTGAIQQSPVKHLLYAKNTGRVCSGEPVLGDAPSVGEPVLGNAPSVVEHYRAKMVVVRLSHLVACRQ